MIVATDAGLPYPPVDVRPAHIIQGGFAANRDRSAAVVDTAITTTHTLIVPDAARTEPAVLTRLLRQDLGDHGDHGEEGADEGTPPRRPRGRSVDHEHTPTVTVFLLPLLAPGQEFSVDTVGAVHTHGGGGGGGGGTSACVHAEVSLKTWTVRVNRTTHRASCNYFDPDTHEAAVLLRTADLRRLDWQNLRPVAESILIQAISRGWRVHVAGAHELGVVRAAEIAPPLYATPHNAEKRARLQAARRKAMFTKIGVKRIVRGAAPGGASSRAVRGGAVAVHEQWVGSSCSRGSARCFGSIIKDTPHYVQSLGRWTPPCCLDKLRQTARHTFAALDRAKVRYWLEGGSLLGAARNGDIIPWDYDVDIGVWKDDLHKSAEIMGAQKHGGIQTQEGFVWEKAREADFYRVQFSASDLYLTRVHARMLFGTLVWRAGHTNRAGAGWAGRPRVVSPLCVHEMPS